MEDTWLLPGRGWDEATRGLLGVSDMPSLPWAAPAGRGRPRPAGACPAPRAPLTPRKVGVGARRRAPAWPTCRLTARVCRGHCSGLPSSAERAVSGGVCACVCLACSLCVFSHTPWGPPTTSASCYPVRQRASSRICTRTCQLGQRCPECSRSSLGAPWKVLEGMALLVAKAGVGRRVGRQGRQRCSAVLPGWRWSRVWAARGRDLLV